MANRAKIAIRVGSVMLCVMLVAAWSTSWLWFGGITPNQTARILIEDSKFGERAVWMAHLWGDRILEPLQTASRDFQLLNDRNAFWVAEVISANKSSRSEALARSLYERELSVAKMVGAVSLAAHGTLAKTEFTTGVFHRVLTDDVFIYEPVPDQSEAPWFGRAIADTTILELALIAAKQAKSIESVPDIIALIAKSPVPYTVHEEAANALAAIGDGRAVPALVDAMRSTDFEACAAVLRALVALGDNRAIPLAIERIAVPEHDGYWSPVANELEALTGQNFGTDKQRWRGWWASQGSPVAHQI